jgi:DNA-3-methyladenine glycosylase II
VSVAAASHRYGGTSWKRCWAKDLPPEALLAPISTRLRACGLSRQKQGYARSLCELVVWAANSTSPQLPQDDDEDAIAELTQIKGIGRWSAEIYLLFAEGRPDIWPAGDLAVQAGLHKLLGLDERPDEKQTARCWPKAGVRIAARRRSSPGIIITARRSSR